MTQSSLDGRNGEDPRKRGDDLATDLARMIERLEAFRLYGAAGFYRAKLRVLKLIAEKEKTP